MSNRKKIKSKKIKSKPPVDPFAAYADAYQCGHCNGRLRNGSQGWGVYHQAGCPVLAGTVDPGPSGRRAAAEASERAGVPVVHGSYHGTPVPGPDNPGRQPLGSRGQKIVAWFLSALGHLDQCPHLPDTAAAADIEAYWVAWDRDVLKCAACYVAAEQRIHRTREDATCDWCHQYVPQDEAGAPRMYACLASPGAGMTLQFGLCPECYRADQEDVTASDSSAGGAA